MKKVVLLALITIIPLFATQRVVVMEDFTATWCTYCPGAARGAEELKFRAFDSVVVIAYHSSTSDPFYTATAASRASYYGITGYPTMRIDGAQSVVGGMHSGTMYPTYRQIFDGRKTVASPLDISLSVTYDSVNRNGNLNIIVRNTSTSTVSGQLHTVIIENHIYYPWQGMDSLQDVERTMLPSASGEAITVPAGDSVIRTRSFTLNSNWVARNCELVVFVQDNSTRWMYQGAMIAVMPEPVLKFSGNRPIQPVPDTTFDLLVAVRNIGSAPATSARATLISTDPYLTVTSANTTFGPIPVGADVFADSPFTVQVSSSCPNPYLGYLQMIITGDYSRTETLNFPVIISTNAGFADDMEHGTNGWTHSGIRDYWHQSNYRNHSPANSWYSGYESGHQYLNEMDARLYTPFFRVGESTWTRFWHYYQTEENYDFALVEVNNGSPFWYQLASFTGTSGGWEQVQLDLSAFQGQTVQLRFRFISDANTLGEGWYLDDLTCGMPLAINEVPPSENIARPVLPALVRAQLVLPSLNPSAKLLLVDATGRKVMELKTGTNDISGISPGVYFIKNQQFTKTLNRLIIVR
uniref:Omp28-related outer membrane protein n=1 Tax=candidate division WOR-3 bacterium TaxID=2052148 RepID=A0A7V3UZE6_UNCW3